MKYILLIVFFVIGIIMFIDGFNREEMSIKFGMLYMLDVYCLTFSILYCTITYIEDKEDKKVEKEIEDIKKIKSSENSDLS